MADLDDICINFDKLPAEVQNILKEQTASVEGDLSECSPDLANAITVFRKTL